MSIGPLYDAGIEAGVKLGREQIISALENPSEEMLGVVDRLTDDNGNVLIKSALRAIASHIKTKG